MQNLTRQDIEIFTLVVNDSFFYEHVLILKSSYQKEQIKESLNKLKLAGFIIESEDYPITSMWIVITHDRWINHSLALPIIIVLTLLTIILLRGLI